MKWYLPIQFCLKHLALKAAPASSVEKHLELTTNLKDTKPFIKSTFRAVMLLNIQHKNYKENFF